MANTYLIDLGINDTLPDVVRKCNQNFRTITSNQNRNLKQESTRTGQQIDNITNEVRIELKNAIDTINAVTAQKVQELNDLIAEAERKIAELEEKLNQLNPPAT